MATSMQEILARKAAEDLAKENAGEEKDRAQQQADRIDQQAERGVENQMLNPNDPAVIKQAAEKSALVAENPQAALNQETSKVLQAENLIDHQGNTTSFNPPENVATGMETSAGGVAVRARDPRILGEDRTNEIQPDSEKASGAKAIYRAIDITRYFLANGTERRAVDGFFYAKTDEDVDMLEHYAENNVVSKVSGGSNTTAAAPAPASTSAPSPASSPAPSPAPTVAPATTRPATVQTGNRTTQSPAPAPAPKK